MIKFLDKFYVIFRTRPIGLNVRLNRYIRRFQNELLVYTKMVYTNIIPHRFEIASS